MKRALILGSKGMVGSAIMRRLYEDPEIALAGDHRDGDLRERCIVDGLMTEASWDVIYLAAARVGGIKANSERPAEFIYDNLMIQSNVIDAAYHAGVKKLVFLGSSCIYPKLAAQPITEDALLTGPLEPTNDAYAIAKIAGIKMCQAYRQQYGFNAISLMPTNLYGPGDKFTDDGHVIPGLMRRFHEAKVSGAPSVTVWGTGDARREFLHVDDLADAAVFCAEHYDSPEPINVGCGEDYEIGLLADFVGATVGYAGRIEFDSTKPDGTPRKLLDCSKLKSMGWKSSIDLMDGLARTYLWYLENVAREAVTA